MKLPIALLGIALSGCVLVPVDAPGGKGGAAGSGLICHKGNKTMELPESAVQAHLDHGDRRGPC